MTFFEATLNGRYQRGSFHGLFCLSCITCGCKNSISPSEDGAISDASNGATHNQSCTRWRYSTEQRTQLEECQSYQKGFLDLVTHGSRQYNHVRDTWLLTLKF